MSLNDIRIVDTNHLVRQTAKVSGAIGPKALHAAKKHTTVTTQKSHGELIRESQKATGNIMPIGPDIPTDSSVEAIPPQIWQSFQEGKTYINKKNKKKVTIVCVNTHVLFADAKQLAAGEAQVFVATGAQFNEKYMLEPVIEALPVVPK